MSPMGFWYINRLPDLGQTTWTYNDQRKKRICKIAEFVVLADHREKLKESEKKKKKKDIDLARELKNLWNMKQTIIPILIGALRIVTKG